MASFGLFEAFLAFFCFLISYYFLNKKPFDYLHLKKSFQSYLWNWPVFGMLPGLLWRVGQLDDIITIIEESNLTFVFKGPCFADMDVLITADPANIHHILSSNFSNYVKGPKLKEILDVYGDLLLNADSDLWKVKRTSFLSLANHQFQSLSINTTKNKLKEVLLPLFDRFAEEGTVVDLQDVFGRFTFDTTLVTLTGTDHCSLSFEMSETDDELAKAFDDASEAVLYRHVLPRFFWKLQSWLGLGQEKKMSEAGATFDRVCAQLVADKREAIRSQGLINHDHHTKEEDNEDILTSAIKLDAANKHLDNDQFFKETILSFVVAGRDTISSALTWFFWLMSQNPKVVANIRQEINTNQPREMSSSIDSKEFLNKLVYLHGALCEAMRLYPPVPFERKAPVKQDVLPSGHRVEANSYILIPIYALGRVRAVWGEDASELKPERWVSEVGGLRHEPSFKFLVFNAGPRTCPGKHLAMILMKIVAVEILQNFDINVVEGHKVEPKPGLTLRMKHGLRVTLSKRCSA